MNLLSRIYTTGAPVRQSGSPVGEALKTLEFVETMRRCKRGYEVFERSRSISSAGRKKLTLKLARKWRGPDRFVDSLR